VDPGQSSEDPGQPSASALTFTAWSKTLQLRPEHDPSKCLARTAEKPHPRGGVAACVRACFRPQSSCSRSDRRNACSASHPASFSSPAQRGEGSHQPAVSYARKDNFAVFGKPRSVPKRLQNIFALQMREVSEDFIDGTPGSYSADNHADRHPQAPNACFYAHHARILGDAIKPYNPRPLEPRPSIGKLCA